MIVSISRASRLRSGGLRNPNPALYQAELLPVINLVLTIRHIIFICEVVVEAGEAASYNQEVAVLDAAHLRRCFQVEAGTIE